MSMHPVNVDADKLALQGMCPVSYHFGPPAKGDPAFTSERNGAVYRFGSKEGKAMFDADPEKYTPAYGNYCAYGMSKGGLAPSDPLNFLLIDGKLNVFLKNETMNTKTMWECEVQDADKPNPKPQAEAHWTNKTYKPPPSVVEMSCNVAIVYYSMYGHVRTLALEVKKGLEAVGCKATLLRVAETLPDEVLAKMGAPGIGKDDEVATAASLATYDALMFGFGTRFGMAPAQVKALMDSTGGLWQKGALIGKPAGLFVSTGTQNGGQETTALTFLTQLTHHGMVFVPMGYSTPLLFDNTEVHGGSPYGCGTIAGPDGKREPSEHEKKVAVHHGEHFGKIAAKLAPDK